MTPTLQYCVALHPTYRLGSQDDARDHAIRANMNTHEKCTWILTPNNLPRPKVPDTMFLHCIGHVGISRTVWILFSPHDLGPKAAFLSSALKSG